MTQAGGWGFEASAGGEVDLLSEAVTLGPVISRELIAPRCRSWQRRVRLRA
jgi:hypothetical protein